jgi:hypothetical protein
MLPCKLDVFIDHSRIQFPQDSERTDCWGAHQRVNNQVGDALHRGASWNVCGDEVGQPRRRYRGRPLRLASDCARDCLTKLRARWLYRQRAYPFTRSNYSCLHIRWLDDDGRVDGGYWVARFG